MKLWVSEEGPTAHKGRNCCHSLLDELFNPLLSVKTLFVFRHCLHPHPPSQPSHTRTHTHTHVCVHVRPRRSHSEWELEGTLEIIIITMTSFCKWEDKGISSSCVHPTHTEGSSILVFPQVRVEEKSVRKEITPPFMIPLRETVSLVCIFGRMMK